MVKGVYRKTYIRIQTQPPSRTTTQSTDYKGIIMNKNYRYPKYKHSIYLYGNKPTIKSTEIKLKEEHDLDFWFKNKVDRILHRKESKGKGIDRDFYFWVKNILNKQVRYIIQWKMGGIENLIKKNNLYVMNGNEQYLNLTPEDVEVIKERWEQQLKLKKTELKVVNTLGVCGIDLLLMLLKTKCNYSETARLLKISRTEIKKLISNDDNLFRILLEIEEMVLDYVELQLMKLVDNGDRNAITYVLNSKGQNRGYGSYEARRRVNKTIRGEGLRDNDFELE